MQKKLTNDDCRSLTKNRMLQIIRINSFKDTDEQNKSCIQKVGRDEIKLNPKFAKKQPEGPTANEKVVRISLMSSMWFSKHIMSSHSRQRFLTEWDKLKEYHSLSLGLPMCFQEVLSIERKIEEWYLLQARRNDFDLGGGCERSGRIFFETTPFGSLEPVLQIALFNW